MKNRRTPSHTRGDSKKAPSKKHCFEEVVCPSCGDLGRPVALTTEQPPGSGAAVSDPCSCPECGERVVLALDRLLCYQVIHDVCLVPKSTIAEIGGATA